METQEEIIERNLVNYVFAMDKAALFIAALSTVPAEEIGFLQVWNAQKVQSKLFEQGENKLFEYTPVWCMQVDFKPEHAAFRAQAESESLFYVPDDTSDRTLINEFFNTPPNEYSLTLTNYLQSISKVV